MTDRYPPETSDDDLNDVLPGVVGELADAVIGHRIVQAERVPADRNRRWTTSLEDLVITLDNGTRVRVCKHCGEPLEVKILKRKGRLRVMEGKTPTNKIQRYELGPEWTVVPERE